MIEVDIYETGKHFMKGRPVEAGEIFTPSIALPLKKGEVSGLTQQWVTSCQNGTMPGGSGHSWSLSGIMLKVLSVGVALMAVALAITMKKLW
ncbi:threonylcarbamoyladenosine tRNA methylthiotransferase-like [Brienomyrus brachyistius]|uniref:threonylcarbamoyladenosine tRNA methylthiotransferase-like n=1 Tax=Brienomyrus brachyistius TaxID=42636 RepID=UPI0020B18E6F|nr:threonylcarbamoyladenosine tRNA methylthiotransferase-like [Brienomyrus brachyistius]